jgi:hypothetical protein
MRRRSSRRLLAVLLALYGAMIVCGPALHSLSGPHDANFGPSSNSEPSKGPASSHDDCPVCHFLSQGQLSVDPPHFPSMDVVRIKPADDLPLTFPSAPDRPSGPRAPPLA